MHVRHLAQGRREPHLSGDRTLLKSFEDPLGEPDNSFPIRSESRERRFGEEYRALLRELADVQRRHRPAGLSDAHKHSERSEAAKRFLESVGSDRVIDHVDAPPPGELSRFRFEILVTQHDDVLAAGIRCGLGFFGGAYCPDDRRAEIPCPLRHQTTDAASGGVNEDDVALLCFPDVVEQIERGGSFQHDRRGRLVGYAVGDLDQAPCRCEAPIAVSPRQHPIGHAVAGLDLVDPGADRLHDTCGFNSQDRRSRERVLADGRAAVINVDEIDTDRGMADEGFAFASLLQIDFFGLEGFRPAGRVNAYHSRLHQDAFS
jgi:hypothetical protein